ncbi:MAG: hypothetical protein JNK11_15805 [Alphaproteobacteria bacterium]|nr:hypothetical protein [Alphaproteobacteria bacterium]
MTTNEVLLDEYRAGRDKCEAALFAFKHHLQPLKATPGELQRYFALRLELFGDAGPIGLVHDYARTRSTAAAVEKDPYPR